MLIIRFWVLLGVSTKIAVFRVVALFSQGEVCRSFVITVMMITLKMGVASISGFYQTQWNTPENNHLL